MKFQEMLPNSSGSNTKLGDQVYDYRQDYGYGGERRGYLDFRCLVRAPDSAKLLPHNSQPYGRSPVCRLMCRFNEPLVLNA